MEAHEKQTRLLARYRDLVSTAVLVFFLWVYYLAVKSFLFWATGALDWTSPDIENAALLLSFPYLAAVWWSHALVMDRIDKLD